LALRSNITNYAEREGVQGELTVVVTLFLSKYGLAKALQVSSSALSIEEIEYSFPRFR